MTRIATIIISLVTALLIAGCQKSEAPASEPEGLTVADAMQFVADAEDRLEKRRG